MYDPWKTLPFLGLETGRFRFRLVKVFELVHKDSSLFFSL
jgi:hypothetical protein